MKQANRRTGSSFDDFLKEQDLYEEVQAVALKEVLAELIAEAMQREGLSKPEMARRMRTSRSQLDRVLDPRNATTQLDTLMKAAVAVGHVLHIDIRPAKPRRTGTSTSRGMRREFR
jgi:antitoxin HicB